MTPREFDAGVVQNRLSLIAGLLDDLDEVGDVTVARLTEDRILRHAVERVLTRVVELAASVNGHVAATLLRKAPQDYRSSFTLAVEAGLIDELLARRLQSSVGTRNVLAHEYAAIDLEMVASATVAARQDYRAYVRAASEWLVRSS